MRLTLRLLTLAVLLSLASFTNLVTRTSMADDSGGDPCGCTAKYNACIGGCNANDQACSMQCTLDNMACDNKCRGLAE